MESPVPPSAEQDAASCNPTNDTNRDIVLAFYQEGLVGLQPRKAFEKAVPDPRWEVIRTIAEGDLVFLHASFTPAKGAPAYAVADVFRLQDCLIVEHRDVVAEPPEQQLNPNPRF